MPQGTARCMVEDFQDNMMEGHKQAETKLNRSSFDITTSAGT